MAELSTADCTKFLATDPGVQASIRAKWSDLDDPEVEDEEREFITKVLKNAANPKKWKRQAKYTVGSKTDTDGSDSDNGCHGGSCYFRNLAYMGGVVREFWLEGTDRITLALLEKDGKLSVIDDLSD